MEAQATNGSVMVVEPKSTLTREQIDLIKTTVARGCTDDELKLFLYTAKRTGLDPLLKQIYAVKRWDNKLKREVMSIQTGIDGYRLSAQRTGEYAGSDDALYQEDEDKYPIKASVTVYRMVQGQCRPFSASARWDEYVQMTKEGQVFSMWERMPYLMLGKCAEALALRKAFPAELSGVYTHEEMMQADNPLPIDSQTVQQSDSRTVKPEKPLVTKEKPAGPADGIIAPSDQRKLLMEVGRRRINEAEFFCWLKALCGVEAGTIRQDQYPEILEAIDSGFVQTWLADNPVGKQEAV